MKILLNRTGYHSVWTIKREHGIPFVIANVNWMTVNSGRVASPKKKKKIANVIICVF